jgi:hypothetical protein
LVDEFLAHLRHRVGIGCNVFGLHQRLDEFSLGFPLLVTRRENAMPKKSRQSARLFVHLLHLWKILNPLQHNLADERGVAHQIERFFSGGEMRHIAIFSLRFLQKVNRYAIAGEERKGAAQHGHARYGWRIF